VPIEFDDSRVDVSGVDDRRGGGGLSMGGGGMAIGGGTGLVGIVIFILFQVLGGGSSSSFSQLGDGSANSTGKQESSEQLEARCNTEDALKQYTDCRMIKVYDIAKNTWSDEFNRRGISYHAPKLAFFDNAVSTSGCGNASAEVGPFYCPGDEEIYLDLNFLEQLQSQLGANGTFAQAYILAHEYGHHLQTLLGTERKVRAAQQQNPDATNEYSVALELQADCYAGVWSKLADQQSSGINLTADNIAEAQKAASAVGDDRIQEQAQGRIDKESWTHGSAADRKKWFTTGATTGDIDQCDTFASL
jgi:predicted metalloprotease